MKKVMQGKLLLSLKCTLLSFTLLPPRDLIVFLAETNQIIQRLVEFDILTSELWDEVINTSRKNEGKETKGMAGDERVPIMANLILKQSFALSDIQNALKKLDTACKVFSQDLRAINLMYFTTGLNYAAGLKRQSQHVDTEEDKKYIIPVATAYLERIKSKNAGVASQVTNVMSEYDKYFMLKNILQTYKNYLIQKIDGILKKTNKKLHESISSQLSNSETIADALWTMLHSEMPVLEKNEQLKKLVTLYQDLNSIVKNPASLDEKSNFLKRIFMLPVSEKTSTLYLVTQDDAGKKFLHELTTQAGVELKGLKVRAEKAESESSILSRKEHGLFDQTKSAPSTPTQASKRDKMKMVPLGKNEAVELPGEDKPSANVTPFSKRKSSD